MLKLSKGQKLSLSKDLNDGGDLTSAQFGLGWQIAADAGEIDLDASAILFDANKAVVDTVWFRNPESKCGSVKSSGDNQAGSRSGDAEVISVDLKRVPTNVSQIVFTVTSFSGQPFSNVHDAYVRISDGKGKELGRYELSEKYTQTAVIMARLYREAGDWKFEPIGEGANARIVSKLVPFIQKRI